VGAWEKRGGGTEQNEEYLWKELETSDCCILGTNKLSLGSPPSQGITQGDSATGISLLGMSNEWEASKPV